MKRRNHRRRKSENEYFYEMKVEDWDAHVSFNDYLYINVFDAGPYEERYYISLKGKIEFIAINKRKRVMPCRVVLHPCDGWKPSTDKELEEPIGDMIVFKEPIGGSKKSILIVRVSIPTKSYELIRSYLSYKVGGTVRFVGTQVLRGKGDVFFLSFDSKSGFEV